MLQLKALDAGYGTFQALFGIDLEVSTGEIVAIIGANGAGKSTLLKAITGLDMPIFPKRRFQHGAPSPKALGELFPRQPSAYRRAFHALYEG